MSQPHDNSRSEMSDEPDDTQVMTTYADSDDEFEQHEPYADFADDGDVALAGRPRRVLVNRYSALLAAVVIGGACFYAGVRVEKGQVSTTSSGGAGTLASRLASAFAGRSGAGSGGSAAGTSAAGGFSGAPGGFALAGGGGTSGTISTISGKTLYITESGGNTVKVDLSSATKLTKTVSVSKRSLYPGDSVTVSGSTGAGGKISATAVSDSGAGSSSTATAASAGSGSSSSSRSSAASALNSLFGG